MPIRTRLPGLLLASMACLPMPLSAAEAQSFGDWGLHCPDKQDPAANCFLSQSVSHRQSGGSLLHVAIGRTPGQDGFSALITVPLGVLLPPGLGLKVDDGEVHPANFVQCLDHGCSANLPLDRALLQELENGREAGIAAVGPDSKAFVVPFSLKGIQAGLRKLSPPAEPTWTEEPPW